MTWIKVDDKLTSHPKWLKLSKNARALWLPAAVWCGAHNNDGVLPEEALPFIAFTAGLAPDEFDPAAADLVKAKLWKRRPKSKGAGYEIVNWLDFQPSRQQVKDRAEADDLKKAMRDLHSWLHKRASGKKVKAIVDARDGMHCRYCGELTVVTPGDRRSPQRRTYDLLDPEDLHTIDQTAAMSQNETETCAKKWVIACGWCNAVKNRRTPEEADMQVLPPRHRTCRNLSQSVGNGSGTVPELGPGLSGSDLAGPGRDGTARSGTGLHATASGPSPVGFASVLDGHDPTADIPHPADTFHDEEPFPP